MALMKVCDLCKSYPGFALQEISFALDAGSITGFIGRNGAGKTTTIKSMLNLVHPDSGEITYFGLPLVGNEAAIKARLGYSTGAVSFYPKKKLGELLKISSSFYPNWDDAACKHYLSLFALDTEKTVSALSDGMKVKVNLLLALSHKAEVLILDEPTSALDPFSRDELLEIFMDLRGEGVSILFSTHIISDIEKCADHVLYIQKGKLLTNGSIEAFRRDVSLPDETVEETMLRLERSGRS